MNKKEDNDMTTYSTPDYRTFEEYNDQDGIQYRNIKTIARKNQAVKEALDQLLIVYELAKDPNDPDLEHYRGIEENLIDDIGTASVDHFNRGRLEGLYDIPYKDKEDFDIFNEEDEQKIL